MVKRYIMLSDRTADIIEAGGILVIENVFTHLSVIDLEMEKQVRK